MRVTIFCGDSVLVMPRSTQGNRILSEAAIHAGGGNVRPFIWLLGNGGCTPRVPIPGMDRRMR